MNRRTKDRIVKFLTGMGNSSDEVANWLREHSVKGCTGGTRGPCPLHVALQNRYPTVKFHGVGIGLVEFKDGDSLNMPNPVRKFVVKFDARRYPDLIEG